MFRFRYLFAPLALLGLASCQAAMLPLAGKVMASSAGSGAATRDLIAGLLPKEPAAPATR